MADSFPQSHATSPYVRRALGHQGTNAGMGPPVNSCEKSEVVPECCDGGGLSDGARGKAELMQAVAPLSLILLLDTSGSLA